MIVSDACTINIINDASTIVNDASKIVISVMPQNIVSLLWSSWRSWYVYSTGHKRK